MLRSPLKSLRRLSTRSQISYGNAQKAITKLKFHAYHVRSIQELKDRYEENCLVYCRWFQSFVNNNRIEELDRVFNSRIWSTDNPNVLQETPLLCQKIGLWYVVSRSQIMGHIFFEFTMNSVVYQDIVTHFISLLKNERYV